MNNMNKTKIEVGTDADITIENIGLISEGKAKLCLSHNQDFLRKIERGACYVENKLALTGQIYGVTTGYGEDCTQGIDFDLVNQLPVNLTRFHGCGLGEFLTPAQTRAVLAVRLVSLCRGVSGVSLALL